MRKQYQIRIRESDIEKISKTVKNFNARVSYAKKRANEADVEFMPPKITVKDALASVETRAEFNRLISKLNRFTAKTAGIVETSKGAKTTKWMLNEVKREDRRIVRENIKKKEALAQQTPLSRGQEMGNFRPFDEATKNVLRSKERNFDNYNQKDFDKAARTIDRMIDASKRREQLKEMRDNYIKGLGERGFLDADPELEKIIRAVSDDEFLLTQQLDDTATFIFYKDEHAEYDVRLHYIRQSWEAALQRSKEKGGKT